MQVPAATQDAILETINEVFAPLVSKVKAPNKTRQQQAWSNMQQDQATQLTSHSSSSNLANAAQSTTSGNIGAVISGGPGGT